MKKSPLQNKAMYLEIIQSEGISVALTRLHHDIEAWEHYIFEGRQGFDPALLAELTGSKAFSRELWEMDLEKKT